MEQITLLCSVVLYRVTVNMSYQSALLQFTLLTFAAVTLLFQNRCLII